MKILVVDDYSTMRRIISNLLGQIGYTDVDQAEDGGTALKKMEEKEYDLVISDYNMVPMTGLELLKKIRAQESFKNTRFILVTAESKTEVILAAKKAGVNNYIVKPFNAPTLLMKIDAVIAQSPGTHSLSKEFHTIEKEIMMRQITRRLNSRDEDFANRLRAFLDQNAPKR